MIRGVPYDHELEYIESTGSQWIDTGLRTSSTNTEYNITYHNVTYLNSSGRCLQGWSPARGDYWGINGEVYETGTTKSSIQKGQGDTVQFIRSGLSITLKVNGYTAVSKSNVALSYGPLQLFALSGGYNGPLKMGRVIVYDSSGLAGDYIPVSVNGVAKMYDRVTGAFPKHYGTFVAGPVASTPLMGVHMYPSFSARLYARRCQIALWDGIETSGWGTHGTSTWKNLVDASQTKALPSGAYFTDNALAFSTDSNGFRIATYKGIFSNDFTLHVCFRNREVSPAGFYCMPISIGGEVSETGIAVQVGHHNSTVETRTGYSSTVVASVPFPTIGGWDYSMHIIWHRSTLTYDVWSGSKYVGSASIPSSEYSSKNYDTMNAALGMYGYSTLDTVYRLFTVSLNSCALTSEEISANYAVDRARFGILQGA